ncbi:MAG: hypothetical protein LIP00_06180 [Parabacteroides sp.]|nr:hypothetical protein [Parabacteroides sp.]
MKDINTTRSRFEQLYSKSNGKKYRYYFFDYLYYRLYITYKKHNDPPRFSACCVFAGTFMIALLFLCIAADCIFTDFFFSRKNFTNLQGGLIFNGLAILFCIIPFYIRYTRKRTAAILLKYKGNKWNRIIPSWVIYTIPLWGFLGGIGICVLIFN